jgi:hypothetical protein
MGRASPESMDQGFDRLGLIPSRCVLAFKLKGFVDHSCSKSDNRLELDEAFAPDDASDDASVVIFK